MTPQNNKHVRERHGNFRWGGSSWSRRNTIQRFVRASLAWIAAFGAVLSIVGGALIATGSVASATTVAPQDCSFGGVTTTLNPTKLGVLSTNAGSSVAVKCSNLGGSPLAYALGQASPLGLIAECNGSTCSSSNAQTMFENEADLNSAGYEDCLFGCGSTWDTTYNVPNPFKSGGSAGGGVITAKGDPNAQCPPTQQQVNVGLPGCALAVIDTNPDLWGLVLLNYTSGQLQPMAPQITLSASSVTPGGKVSVSNASCTPNANTTSSKCPYFWGDPVSKVPSSSGQICLAGSCITGLTAPVLDIELCPASGSGSCTSISNPATAPVVTVAQPLYNFNTSTDTGTMTTWPTISGSITIPSTVTAGSYNLDIFESNLLGFDKGNGTNCPSGTTAPNGAACIEASASLTVGSSTSTTPTISSISPTGGSTAGGTSVAITGTNFTSAATVKFGSTAATSVKYTSATSLTAVSPAESAGTVQVTVATSSGTSNGESYTYTAPTGPTITSITPDSSPLAGGGTATIIGTNLSSISAVNFGATPATNVKGVSSTEITATIPAATSPGLVNVTVQASSTTSPGVGFMYVTSQIPYTPVTPYRIADTRCSASPQPAFCSSENLPTVNQSLSSPSAGGSITVQVTGTGSGSNAVPSTAQSVVVTVTAIAGLTAKNGYLTVYPAGTNPPTASSLNYAPGMAIPNLVTATLGSGGSIDILSSSANVNIVVDVEGYYDPSSSSSTNKFTPLPLPVRVLDTRCEGTLSGSSYCTGLNLPTANQIPAPGASSYIKVEVAGLGSIPVTATAVSLVVTAAGPGSGGYLTVFPAGSSTTPPETSNVNFHKDIASADSVTVAVGTGGFIYIYNSAGTATNVIVDINGYFSSAGDTLTPSSPVRICDTRSLSPGDVASGVSGQCANSGTPLTPSGGPITVQVTGIAGIPSTAQVVVANITVVNTTGSGYLTAWAAGATQPSTSNINWGKGQVMPNMVISALSSSGQMEIYCSSQANVIIDVVGWYS